MDFPRFRLLILWSSDRYLHGIPWTELERSLSCRHHQRSGHHHQHFRTTHEELWNGPSIGGNPNGQEQVPAEPHVDESTIHMPSPSYWPIWIAAGVALMGGGILSHFALSFVGGVIVFLGVIGWANEPTVAPNAHDVATSTQH